jgi:radical SAM superfamily enzyme YgiQ (UPF0313 family)
MVYKKGPRFKIRPVKEIKEDLLAARDVYGPDVSTLFFPAGNTIAMKTDDLCAVCSYAREIFNDLQRITVYGSSQYICKKNAQDLRRLAAAGLSRIHVGMESGDDIILKRIRKGSDCAEQIEAGKMVRAAGIELSIYVILGIGGQDRSQAHAMATARALNQICPDFIRLRTFLPKMDTPILEEICTGAFTILGPHEILIETALLIERITSHSYLTSDHYTNYINLEGWLPDDREPIIKAINTALEKDEDSFRPFFIGDC